MTQTLAHRLICRAGGVPRWLQLPPLLLERVRVLAHMQVPEHLQQHQQQQQQSMQQEQAVPEVHVAASVLNGAGPCKGGQQREAAAAADAALSDDDDVMLIGSSSGEEEEQERTARGQQQHAGHQEQQQQRQQQQGGGQCGAVQDADGCDGIEDEVILISSDDEAEAGVGLQGGAGGLCSSGGQGQGQVVEATGAAAGGAEAVEAAARAVGSRSACAHQGLQQPGTAVVAAAAAAAGVCGTGTASASDAGRAAKCSHESGTGGRYVLYWMQVRVLCTGQGVSSVGHKLGTRVCARTICGYLQCRLGRRLHTRDAVQEHVYGTRKGVPYERRAAALLTLLRYLLGKKQMLYNCPCFRRRPSAGTKTLPWTPPAPPPPPCACRCAAPPSYCRTVTRTPHTAGSSSSLRVGCAAPLALAPQQSGDAVTRLVLCSHLSVTSPTHPVTARVHALCALNSVPCRHRFPAHNRL